MTDTTVIALIGAGTTIAASLIAAYSSNKAASRAAAALLAADRAVKETQENTKLTQATSDKVDEVGNQTTQIHTATNSHLSEMTNQFKLALERIAGLEATALAIAKERMVSDKERAAIREDVDIANGAKPPVDNDGDPLPVIDIAVVDKLDKIVTPALNDIKATVEDIPKK